MHHNTSHLTSCNINHEPADRSDVANLCLEVLQFLLYSSVLLGHLLELGLPLIAVLLESLDFTFEVTGLDIGLAEPKVRELATYIHPQKTLKAGISPYLSFVSLKFLSASSASSSNNCSLRWRASFCVPCC